jgi:hypothetical protein
MAAGGLVFCNRCGTPLQPGFSVCPRCAKQIGDPTRSVAQDRLEGHLRLLGILWIVLGSFFVVPAAFLLLFGSRAHFVLHDHQFLPQLIPLLLYLGGGALLILGAGGICVGLGLMQRQIWARTAAIILGILGLFHPPFGTALGIYTLWVLLADEHGDEYLYLARTRT